MPLGDGGSARPRVGTEKHFCLLVFVFALPCGSGALGGGSFKPGRFGNYGQDVRTNMLNRIPNIGKQIRQQDCAKQWCQKLVPNSGAKK